MNAAAASAAAVVAGRGGGGASFSPAWLLIVAFASLAPFLVLMLTSFVKVAVVLSILRSALGGGGANQIPPSSVITGLAILLSAYVMAPTGQRIYAALEAPTNASAPAATAATPHPVGAALARSRPSTAAPNLAEAWLRDSGVSAALDLIDRAKEPVRDFLSKNADPRERESFRALAVQMRLPGTPDGAISNRDFLVLAPAFVTSELRRAFEIGFLLFLPFLVLDLVIANLLTALGMVSLNPAAVSLPFKLLLFVLIDGWHLVARG